MKINYIQWILLILNEFYYYCLIKSNLIFKTINDIFYTKIMQCIFIKMQCIISISNIKCIK